MQTLKILCRYCADFCRKNARSSGYLVCFGEMSYAYWLINRESAPLTWSHYYHHRAVLNLIEEVPTEISTPSNQPVREYDTEGPGGVATTSNGINRSGKISMTSRISKINRSIKISKKSEIHWCYLHLWCCFFLQIFIESKRKPWAFEHYVKARKPLLQINVVVLLHLCVCPLEMENFFWGSASQFWYICKFLIDAS